MSKQLKTVKIDGFDYEVMGRPRYYVLSKDTENHMHLTECGELYYDTHSQRFFHNGHAFNQNTTSDYTKITAQLSNNTNRLYFFSDGLYEGYTDFSFKAYDRILAIPVKEIYGTNGYTCSFDKLDYFN